MGYFWLSLAENFHQKNAGIMRNHQILATLITIIMSLSIGQIGANQPEKRPNILFIMSDDHAENAISTYGSNLIQTPNIDRLADEGMRFENSFVTNSICGPSRAVLLTGKFSHLNGLRDNRDRFDSTQTTFPKLLQNAGYYTAMIGKWHLKSAPTGFDNWEVLVGQGRYYNPIFIVNGERKELTGYTTDIITEKAIAALDNRDPDKPFCMLVHHKAPHRNWMPDTKYLEKFNQDLPYPETLFDDYAGRSAAAEADMRISDMYLSYDMKLHPGDYETETGSGGNTKFAENIVEIWKSTYELFTPDQKAAWDAHYDSVNAAFRDANLSGEALLKWKYQRYMKDYLRCVLSVDDGVGKLLDYLDAHDLAKNTIVVYTSDQGFYLGEHGWYDKRFMYEPSLSMPLLIRFPREIAPGSMNTDLVQNLDFAPTFLDLANTDIPDDMQGQSLKPLFTGKPAADWRTAIYYHYYEYPHGWHDVRKHYGIRTDRYKLIHFYDAPDTWELFDLQSDPNEMHNIFDDPNSVSIREQLGNELTALQKKYADPVDQH